MSSIEISVLLPVYNSQSYLKEAIESVLRQSYKSFELIIINDGSTDNSENIIKSFSDTRIVYFKNPGNIGLIKTLNIAIGIAKGNYLARMDADDVSLPDRLKLQFQVFKENKDVVVVSSDHYLLEGNNIKYIKNYNESDELKTILLFSPSFAHPTVMVKNIFKSNQISYDENFTHAEDYKLWVDLASCGKFYNINQPLLKYRSHSGQVSVLHNKIQKEKSEIIRKFYLQKLGFSFTEGDLVVHNMIGNNIFIKSLKELEQIETWLENLLLQNKQSYFFDEKQFNNIVHKFWYDSCGYSNLGLKAFHLYNSSKLSKNFKVSFKNKITLLAKCVIRGFK